MSEQKTEQMTLAEAARDIPGVADDTVAVEVAGRLDWQTPLMRKAFEFWWQARQSELQTEPMGKMVHRFVSAEVRERMLQFMVAEILEEVAILKAHLAQQRRKEMAAHFSASVAEHDLFFEQEEDRIFIHRGEVWRVTKADELEAVRQTVAFVRELATGTASITAEDALNEKLPAHLRRYGIGAFTKDVGDFLPRHGEEGREIMRRICDDKEMAEQVEAHPQSPLVLQHLAGLCKMLNAAALPKAASRMATPVGFAAA